MASWSAIARRIRVPLGFAFAVLYVWLANPSLLAMLLGVALVTVGLVIRGLASGHLRKNEQLAVSGPYAYTRNPLYMGSLILGIGFLVAARSWWIAAAAAVFFVIIYLPVIGSEEAFLRERFPEFDEYARQVPRLLPRLTPAGGEGKFSWDLYWQHREYNALLGSLALMAALAAKLTWLG